MAHPTDVAASDCQPREPESQAFALILQKRAFRFTAEDISVPGEVFEPFVPSRSVGKRSFWAGVPPAGVLAPAASLCWLAGAGGFEPPYGGIKIRCLTTWLRPNNASRGKLSGKPIGGNKTAGSAPP